VGQGGEATCELHKSAGRARGGGRGRVRAPGTPGPTDEDVRGRGPHDVGAPSDARHKVVKHCSRNVPALTEHVVGELQLGLEEALALAKEALAQDNLSISVPLPQFPACVRHGQGVAQVEGGESNQGNQLPPRQPSTRAQGNQVVEPRAA
jgi:hypothetical protein